MSALGKNSVSNGNAPCAMHIKNYQVQRLAGLSAPGLSWSAVATRMFQSASRCVDVDVGHAAVAVQVAPAIVNQLWIICRRGRFCPNRPGSRSSSTTSTAKAWFMACVPLKCLGDDHALETLAWRLLWRKLASQRRTRKPLVGEVSSLRLARLFGDARFPPVTEAPLAQSCVEGAGHDGPFDVVTVTDSFEKASALRDSLPQPLRLRFLHPPLDGGHWRFHWFDAERYLLAYTAHLRRRGFGDRLVVYADGFDTAWLGCDRNLTAVLEGLGTGIFFGAEFDLFPAGTLAGYPLPLLEPAAVVELLGKQRGRPLTTCRKPRALSVRWEPESLSEMEPCLAMSEPSSVHDDVAVAQFLNGGVYGGRAKDLEVALRRLLGKQRLLARYNQNGAPYRQHGRTHQYLWGQYFVDRWHEVALDYGGSFVVNLAQRSIAPRQFGRRSMSGPLHSVLFQKPVCLVHANGGGYADDTMNLLRVATALKFDTTVRTGLDPEEFDAISSAGLAVDVDRGARIVIDGSLCFPRMKSVRVWNGALTAIDLVTPENAATFQGLQFAVLRSSQGGDTPAAWPSPVRFQVIELQHAPIFTRGTGQRPPPNKNSTGAFAGRNRLDISPFRLRAREGDCVGWRCLSRCDLTFAPLEQHSRAERHGVWVGHASGDVTVGDVVTFDTWQPRRYAIGAEAEVLGVGFYAREDGG